VFVRTERGMLDQPAGIHAAGYAEQWLPGTPEVAVPGVNHYSIMLRDAGADAVGNAVRGGVAKHRWRAGPHAHAA
jgi:hypothetical protein